ncbi:MAG: late competence development ComFB family protein [Oscillospiraceae bacterium]|nr:late competence development ComFB family protein [Oscillospiraceae bacterium]
MSEKKKLSDINKNLMFSKIMPSYKASAEGSCTQGSANPESENLQYININELIIISSAERIMTALRCCRCSRCMRTVILDALNRIPADYIYTTHTDALRAAGQQPTSLITDTIVNCALSLKSKGVHAN